MFIIPVNRVKKYLEISYAKHLIIDSNQLNYGNQLINITPQSVKTVFYKDSFPKTVLCRINPGRFGAAKTGVSFIDFTSLSQMIDGVNRDDSERSAKFFFDVVQEFGVKRFYQNF